MRSWGITNTIAISAVFLALGMANPTLANADETPADLLEVLPEKQRYEPTKPIPAGYRLVEGPRKPLLISGAITFGIGYLPMLGFGTYMAAGGDVALGALTATPLLGPYGWWVLSSGHLYNRTAANLFIVDGVLQTVGIGLLIAGAIAPGKYLKRQDVAAVVPSVTVGPRFVGMQWSF